MISAKWVPTWKTDEHGRVTKAIARLVARGFSQREGIDYFETFAPTPAAACIRLLAATAYELNLDLFHFDAGQAFVQSNLEEDVFLRLPEGCSNMSGKIVGLNRSFFGLEQESRSCTVICSPACKFLGLGSALPMHVFYD